MNIGLAGRRPWPKLVRMKDLALIVIHIFATTAKLLGPGGLRAVVAENALLRQQLIVLRRAR